MIQLTPFKSQKHNEDGKWWLLRCEDLCEEYRRKGIQAELKFNRRGEVAVYKESPGEGEPGL